MKRIIIHWTAGGYYPTTAEKEVYHFLVDKDGKVYNGKFAPENNLKCVKGCYAAHTGGGNTCLLYTSRATTARRSRQVHRAA